MAHVMADNMTSVSDLPETVDWRSATQTTHSLPVTEFTSGWDNSTELIYETHNTTESTVIGPGVPVYQLISYICIGIFGILDNGLVIIVLCRSRTVRCKIVNMFLINQSVIDLVTSFLLAITANNNPRAGGHSGLAGEFYCRLWVFKTLLWSAITCSTYNLVAITLERYLEVCHPIWHKVKVTRTRVAVVFVLVWTIGPLENILSRVITNELKDGYCYQMTNWPAPWVGQFTGVLIVVLEFFIPIVIMIFVYTKMVISIRTRVAPAAATGDSVDVATIRREEKMHRIRKNILRTLFLVCACFILCWAWNQIYFLLFNLHLHRNLDSYFYHFTVYAAFLNCIINPFVYAAQYQDFQQQAKRLFTRRRQDGSYPNDSGVDETQVSSIIK